MGVKRKRAATFFATLGIILSMVVTGLGANAAPTELSPIDGSPQQIEATFFRLTNEVRAANGKPALVRNSLVDGMLWHGRIICRACTLAQAS
jgi:uncharacterized protein YkwD